MKLPSIDIASLPELGTKLTGIFGSIGENTPGHDDTIVILATFAFEVSPPGGGIL
ncbi:hypothetical protein [Tsuneonella sp. HG222]